jgi:hypothetical protein
VIILSVGMPRAGSGWYYNLTNELMLAHGAQDALASASATTSSAFLAK